MSKKYSAVKVPVYEYERGWGSKIDDYMVCLTTEDAKKFVAEFNSKNTEKDVPDWYMVAESSFSPLDITIKQMKKLKKSKRMWLANLKDVK